MVGFDLCFQIKIVFKFHESFWLTVLLLIKFILKTQPLNVLVSLIHLHPESSWAEPIHD